MNSYRDWAERESERKKCEFTSVFDVVVWNLQLHILDALCVFLSAQFKLYFAKSIEKKQQKEYKYIKSSLFYIPRELVLNSSSSKTKKCPLRFIVHTQGLFALHSLQTSKWANGGTHTPKQTNEQNLVGEHFEEYEITSGIFIQFEMCVCVRECSSIDVLVHT